MPQDRISTNNFVYGYREPVKLNEGKITLKLLDEIIDKYTDNKSEENLIKLSQNYRLNKEVIENLVEHYKSFTALKDILNNNNKKENNKATAPQQAQKAIENKSNVSMLKS